MGRHTINRAGAQPLLTLRLRLGATAERRRNSLEAKHRAHSACVDHDQFRVASLGIGGWATAR